MAATSIASSRASGSRQFRCRPTPAGVANPLAEKVAASAAPGALRAETTFESFDAQDFGKWTAKGEAFRRPRTGAVGKQTPVTGYLGSGLVNSFEGSDRPQGTLTS